MLQSDSGFAATGGKPVQIAPVSSLEVALSHELGPQPGERELLLGFQFGPGPVEHEHPAVVGLELRPIGCERLFECWWYKGAVTYTRSGQVRIAECHDYTVAIVQKEAVHADGFREQTHQAYHQLLEAVRSTAHPKLARVWNYFGNINSGDGDSEKYRQFSIGRAEAFRELDIGDGYAPTGTAIGTQTGSGLTLIALASNLDFCPVENPRQVSAFKYPRIYGPRSPKFSRGGFVRSRDHTLYLISGTAAIVGHQSNFPFDTRLQTEETLNNLAHLCDAISGSDADELPFVLDDQSILRVYLKNPEDHAWIAQKINREIKGGRLTVAYLHGTICRRELMVEIEGVKIR